jgi:hypothetical protein
MILQETNYKMEPASRSLMTRRDGSPELKIRMEHAGNIYHGSSRRHLITQHGNESSTSKTFYVWAGEAVITEYTEPSGATMPRWSKNYIYLEGNLVATEEPKAGGGELVSYHHPDRLGTRLVTNNADTTVIQQSNLPYGTSLDTGPTTNRRFTSYDCSGVSFLDYAIN